MEIAQIIVAFVFGLAFLITLIVLAIKFPTPTPFQYTVFRIVLAVAAAGVAAMIPGFINIDMTPATQFTIRAGGAIAVFVMVFFFNPAQLAIKEITAPPELKGATVSIPNDWTFQVAVEKMLTSINSIPKFEGFTVEQLRAPLRSAQMHDRTVEDLVRQLRLLVEQSGFPDYEISRDGATLTLIAKK